MRKLITAVALVAAGAATATAPALAANVACGQVITKSIAVSNDLENCPGSGLVIGAANISINLKGHTIDGNDAGFDFGIDNSAGHDGLKVKDGVFTDFAEGVRMVGQIGGRLDHVTANSNFAGITIFNSRKITLFESTGNENSQGTVFGSVDQITIDGGEYNDNTFSGPNLFSDSDRVTIRRVQAAGNDVCGICVQNGSDNVFLDRVDASGNGDDPLVFNCRCGVFMGNGTNTGGKVSRSEFSDNGLYGVLAVATVRNVTFDRNLANHNGVDGFGFFGGVTDNVLSRNEAESNGQYGIRLTDPNTDGGGNKAQFNGTNNCLGIVCS